MKKTKIFETTNFADVAAAQAIIDGYENKIKRIKNGLIISGISLLLMAIRLLVDFETATMLLGMAFCVTIAAYIVGGGFKIALRTALKIGKIGWFICPFPIDIFTGLITFLFAIAAFFYFPLVFVLINLAQAIRDKREAETYLTYGAAMYQQAQYTEPQHTAPQNVAPQYATAQNTAPRYTAPAVAPQGNRARPTPPPFRP